MCYALPETDTELGWRGYNKTLIILQLIKIVIS